MDGEDEFFDAAEEFIDQTQVEIGTGAVQKHLYAEKPQHPDQGTATGSPQQPQNTTGKANGNDYELHK